jgi:hypothetical protein
MDIADSAPPIRRLLIAEITWFIERNHLDGTPPDDEGATDEDLAARLPGYVQATQAVRNLAAAIRDLDGLSGLS